jgi:hypothetical protein
MKKLPATGCGRQLHEHGRRHAIGRTVRLSDAKVTTYCASVGQEWVCVILGIREQDRPNVTAASRPRRSKRAP